MTDRRGADRVRSPAFALLLRATDAWIAPAMHHDPELLRRARIAVSFSFALLVLGFETLVFFVWVLPSDVSAYVGYAMAAGLSITLGVPVALRRYRSVSLATNLLLTAAYGVIVTIFVLLGGMRAPVLHWTALLPMLAMLMGARRSAWVWGGISLVTLGAFTAINAAGVEVTNHMVLEGRIQWIQRFVDVTSWIGMLFAVALLYERHKDERTADLEREIAQRERAEERTHFLAYHDALTMLPNRENFKQQLRDAMEDARSGDRMVAVLFLDLDGFKEVNDTHGHGFGDELLRLVAMRLKGCVRAADAVARDCEAPETGVVSRLGGDEFTVLLVRIRGPEEAALVSRRILDALERPMEHEGQEVYISASIGIALFPGDVDDIDGLLRNADLAMYHAKERGKNNYQFFDDSLNTAAQRRSTLAKDLRGALERDEFELHYQPIFATRTREAVGVEALVRWRHPRRGLLAPGEFIEVAEETGLILPLGAWIAREACLQSRRWRDAGGPPLRMAINVSSVQFRGSTLVRTLEQCLSECDLSPKTLELEVTESAMMEDEEDASRVLGALKTLGVRIALDDFGTGYSSLSYVKRFPVDAVKIDRAFVRELGEDPDARAIVTAIIAMAHGLNLGVVAEGVETAVQERFLEQRGCDELQGYRFGRPMPPDALAELLWGAGSDPES